MKHQRLRCSMCGPLPCVVHLPFAHGTVTRQHGVCDAHCAVLHRGPGDFLGKKQSGRDGLSYLKAAKLPEDRQLLEQARAAAAELVQEYGLEPSGWPKHLLAALKDRSLPDLDLSEMSQLTWGSSKDMEAVAEAGN